MSVKLEFALSTTVSLYVFSVCPKGFLCLGPVVSCVSILLRTFFSEDLSWVFTKKRSSEGVSGEADALGSLELDSMYNMIMP